MIDAPTAGGDAHLAHAYLQRIADDQSLRLLHIKGPISTTHEVAAPRTHSDADVLVAPADHDAVCRALEEHGWTPFRDTTAPRLLDLHSRAYRRAGWHCSIDVHRYYPGFFADPDVAFEHLWSRRMVTTLGAWEVTTPCVVDLACVVSVHAARDAGLARSQRDLDVVVGRCSSGELDVADLVATARQLRALTTLAPLFAKLHITPEDDLTTDERTAWEVVQTNDGSTTAIHWYVAWRTGGWRQRRALVLAAARTLLDAFRAETTTGESRVRAFVAKLALAAAEVRRMRARLPEQTSTPPHAEER